MRPKASADAILAVQKATADGIRLLNDAAPTDPVHQASKRAGGFAAAAADGKATKIIIPSEIQGIAGLAKGVVESVKDD